MTGASPGHDPVAQLAVTLRVPGAEAYIQILRATMGRAAAMLGFGFDGVEDLALAVDEAAVLVLGARPETLTLHLRALDGAGIEARLLGEGASGEWPPGDPGWDTRWKLLNALCEHSWVITEGDPGVGLAQTTR